jgi:hypothetical protein
VFGDFEGLDLLQELCCSQMSKQRNFIKGSVINVYIIMFANRAIDLINCQRPNGSCWIFFSLYCYSFCILGLALMASGVRGVHL